MGRINAFDDREDVQEDLIFHRLAVLTDRDGEPVHDIKSKDKLPIPRIGENFYHNQVRAVPEGEEPAFQHDVTPGADRTVYRVKDINHEYLLMRPEGGARKNYAEGLGVTTIVLVEEKEI